MYEQSDEHNKNTYLTLEDLRRIEETDLSSLDKHYVRLLAHCLASFKSMVKDQAIGEIPDVKTRSQWLLTQYSPETDEAFLYTLLEQLGSAAIQLEHLAIYYQLSPLELTLEHLISSIQGRLGNDQ